MSYDLTYKNLSDLEVFQMYFEVKRQKMAERVTFDPPVSETPF